jgi:hypothetical protein
MPKTKSSQDTPRKVSFYATERLMKEVEKAAAESDRTVSNQLRQLIRRGLESAKS